MTSASSDPGVAAGRGWATDVVRTSGLVLFVLLVAHVVDMFILHDIENETAQTFTDRWSNPTWRAVDWVLVVLALVHGTIGLRPVIASGVTNPQLRGLMSALLYGIVGVLVALVTFVAFTFRFS